MNDVERKALKILAAALGTSVDYLVENRNTPNMTSYDEVLPAIIAALTPPEGYVLIKASTLSDLADDAEALIVQTEFREGRRDMRLASVREAREAMNSNQEAVQ